MFTKHHKTNKELPEVVTTARQRDELAPSQYDIIIRTLATIPNISPLILAIAQKNFIRAIRLVKNGIDPSLTIPWQEEHLATNFKKNDFFSWNALHLAVFLSFRLSAVLPVIDAILASAHPQLSGALNAKIDVSNIVAPGYTPLLLELALKKQQMAIDKKKGKLNIKTNWQLVGQLIKAGSNPALYRDCQGRYAYRYNALHLIALANDVDVRVCQILIEANHPNLPQAFSAFLAPNRSLPEEGELLGTPLNIAQAKKNRTVLADLRMADDHFSGKNSYLALFLTQKNLMNI